MTPREIAGSLYFAERRRKRKAAEQLALDALPVRGEPRELKKQIEDLRRDRTDVAATDLFCTARRVRS